ncbi:MAG: transcription-repair coupling factor [Lachnospiraceae bacterium]|nr:transcription-repair coupling factor [Lachnospiraceae bacterium]
MKAVREVLRDLADYETIQSFLEKETGMIQISGCADAGKAHMVYGVGNGFCKKIIATFSEQKARELYEDCRFFDRNTVYYPAKDILFYQSDLRGNQLTKERMNAIRVLLEEEEMTFITTFDGLMNRLMRLERLEEFIVSLRLGDTLNLESFSKKLVTMGYEKSYQAEMGGQFATRGGILDVYPLTEENPYRIELWGDEIDSIRSFSADSQRSIENLEEIRIYPASEAIFDERKKKDGLKKIQSDARKIYDIYRNEMKTEEAHRVELLAKTIEENLTELGLLEGMDTYLNYFEEDTVSLLDYFPKDTSLICLDEPVRVAEKGRVIETEFKESMKQRLEKGYLLPGQMEALYSYEEIAAKIESRKVIGLSALEMREKTLPIKKSFSVHMKTVNPYNNSFELLIKDLKQYKKNGYRVVLLSGSKTRANRMAQDLSAEGLNAFYTDEMEHEVKPGEVMTAYGKIKKGYEYPDLRFVVISESDIFGREKKKKRKRRTYEGEKIQSFSDLNVGDYVVHENHGLGIYRGIEKVEVDKVVKDYIKIEYAKGGNLYILATQLELIQKYAGSDAKKPRLNRLGTQEWNKTKTRVRKAVDNIAQDLVELYAKRQNREGFSYGKDTVWQREFEEMFPFEETEDQELAIEATKRDMESRKIMDRLICGDVGYGKTEIAIRAAFKAVLDGKQVVYLVPTTILAQQHYNTFAARMKDFPVRVDLLCRFRTNTQQKKTIEDLKRGMVDIIIGTHRVLSKDVNFKDLGLLIIDEEQRFGVAHKEKIKQMREDIDVLTLTATPIPRTLHMSLIGIRDMSVLEEAPMDRMPIQTYVMEYNEELIREAIVRELSRDGQVYYVFNRVNQIEDVTAKIESLVPEASVAFAHGQMKERELEDRMYSFINGEIDVLVSTTIIETGLDISNVNTMIIHDADNMGLSQLYQLRGRVGRSNRTAYAFLLYRRDKMLKEIAEKRLAAIKEFTELGSGFKIAMRDLEIRGAGNLLGAEQHGHMEAVGYDLYCKMLNEAVKKQKGEKQEESFDTSLEIDIDAYIPASYIPNEFQKLDIYKRIAGIENQEESEEMLEELIDRFGDLPKSVENLLWIAKMKATAHACYLTEISQKRDKIHFVFLERAAIDPSKIPELIDCYRHVLDFTPEQKAPYFTYHMKSNSRQKKFSAMEIIEKVLKDVEETLVLKKMEM